MTWQARKPARVPERIVRAASAAEVASAVLDARSSGLVVSARSGGHSYHGTAVPEGGVLLDLAGLAHISVDSGRRVARVGATGTGAQLAAAADKHKLAFPGPHDGRVALAGFLLAGGIGLNVGKWGPGCASVRAIEVVTARGEIVTADGEHNHDLLWAARGGGPWFPGVITSFEVDLRPAPALLRNQIWIYPQDLVSELADHISRVLPDLSASLELVVLIVRGPSGEQVVLVRCAAWADSPSEAEALLKPLADFPHRHSAVLEEAVDLPSVSRFHELYAQRHESPDHRRAVDAFWVEAAIQSWLPQLAEGMRRAPSRHSKLLVVVLPTLERSGDRAFSATGTFNVEPGAAWEREAEDEANLAWLGDIRELLSPLAVGHYVASADPSVEPARGRRSFGREEWGRLERVRLRWDPDRVFASYPTA
ncbi:MAG: FAD-binding oxidoreductase [Solirubrobacterales bacterium]|nr:FAD-binding oxidoreductase [Solirubrobacterales bacterium]